MPYRFDTGMPPFSMINRDLQFEPKMIGLSYSSKAQQWLATDDRPTATPVLFVVGLNCSSQNGRAYIILTRMDASMHAAIKQLQMDVSLFCAHIERRDDGLGL